jgi:rod shape-determining protein MreD
MTILRRVLFCPLAVLVAVLGQLTLVNRAPLPGGGGVPDLVLLVVAALGVVVGPTTGMLAGFAGGLAMDVAPPGGHLAGEYALVYCLVGYACGRVRDIAQGSSADRSAVASLTVMAVGVAAGEAGKAALGLMLSDPNMTGPAIRHVLPAALVYDLLLSARPRSRAPPSPSSPRSRAPSAPRRPAPRPGCGSRAAHRPRSRSRSAPSHGCGSRAALLLSPERPGPTPGRSSWTSRRAAAATSSAALPPSARHSPGRARSPPRAGSARTGPPPPPGR